ncbi:MULTISPECIES: F0F1 ATP synthase subunit epsilon [Clostridium]|uniref:F0F1 ATP synthase subunit epsilon n=1 Tax=Clostridium TaxID=1485 RepID=UPI00069CEDBC|nr:MULTISPECIES: F0F1 ATP synthase subunit epsilon [Clostridium]KOF57226.1 ATP synthase F0F1 subunit epsilon [Clostridium sp. DMHC 10]MCD2347002.1 F0F1 ATP synthase subunit epsilon [Clostridium guangxiense]
MATNMKLSILTPKKTFYVGEVSEISTKTVEGGLGILGNHSDMVAFLQPTETKFIQADGTEKRAFTSTGVLNVGASEVTFMCDASEWPEDIDVNRAEEAKERAEKRIRDAKNDNVDLKRAELALSRALARIKVKEK